MKRIYIVFSQTNTIISKILKFITKDEYNHVSLTFNENCKEMYSFGRKYTYFALIGCFNTEDICKGLYKIKSNSKMAIYSLTVTDDQYLSIVNKINYIKLNSKGYNIIGLLLAYFRIKLNRNKYYCSEFVYDVLSDKNVNILDKDNILFKPCELKKINGLHLIYEGRIRDYPQIY